MHTHLKVLQCVHFTLIRKHTMELFVYQNNTLMVCILLFLLQTVVVKTTVYLTDLKDYAAVNSAYSEGKVGIIV